MGELTFKKNFLDSHMIHYCYLLTGVQGCAAPPPGPPLPPPDYGHWSAGKALMFQVHLSRFFQQFPERLIGLLDPGLFKDYQINLVAANTENTPTLFKLNQFKDAHQDKYYTIELISAPRDSQKLVTTRDKELTLYLNGKDDGIGHQRFQ